MRTETLVDSLGRRWLVRVPTRRRERIRGLRGSRPPGQAQGLMLRTRSIHTVGMRGPIDVVLLDAQLRVVDVITASPGRVVLPRRRVRWILEAAPGSGLRPGDRVQPSRASATRLSV